MSNSTSHSGHKLLVTGDPAGYQNAHTVLVRLPHLGKQIGTYRHAEFVVVVLVAEAAGHPAALDRGGDDVESRSAEHVDGLRCGVAGPLLAVRVIKEADTETGLSCRKELRKIDTVCLGDVPQSLKRLEAVGGERGDGRGIVQEVLVIEPQHGQHTGFDDDDLAA